MKIVAFAYKKGVGKDTLGKFLMTDLRCRAPGLNIKHVSFAAKLKDVSNQLYSWAGLRRAIYYETHRKEKEEILPLLGCSPREIWIGVGNKLREFHPSTWLDCALKGKSADILIITDCGFTNEAAAVHEAGGWLCKIVRDGLEQGTDAREVELDTWTDWDYIIDNNGSFADLNAASEKIVDRLLK